MWPEPKSNGSAVVAPSSLAMFWRAVVISADLTWAGVHFGYFWINSAAMPDTCGVDIEVPCRYCQVPPWNRRSVQACGLRGFCTPGAVTSGLIQSGTTG